MTEILYIFLCLFDQCLCPLPECNFHENQVGVCFLHYYISIIKYSIQEVFVE